MKRLLCATFIFLFSMTSFADDVADLSSAIANENTTKIKELLEKEVDQNKLGYFDISTISDGTKSLLFDKSKNKNSLDPNKLALLKNEWVDSDFLIQK